MSKVLANPNEIFGFPAENITKTAEENIAKHYCRFLNKKCVKQSRLIEYPLGLCSVNQAGSKAIICPHRFLEDNVVFKDIAENAFGTIDNVLLFSELKLKNIGNFDFVLVKHKPISSVIKDFCVVEFQSDSITGTGKLVDAMKDFMQNENVLENHYTFGLNTYNTIKLSYIQMLIKGQAMELWNKNIYWVIQKYVFNNIVNRFMLAEMDYNENDNTKYLIYDLFKEDSLYKLRLVEQKSASISKLLSAFTKQNVPPVDEFIEILESKINLKLGLTIG